MSTPIEPSTDEQLGLDAPPPSPDAKDPVALRRFYAPLAVAVIGVAVVLFLAKGLPPVTTYAAEVAVDGKPPASATVTADSMVEVTLTPKGDPGGPVEAWVFVEEGGVVRRAMDAHPQVADDGAISMKEKIGPALGLSEGDAQVILLVTRPGGAPETPKASLGEGPWYAERFSVHF